jgi:hopene-associated glycosyltransferase HpnB
MGLIALATLPVLIWLCLLLARGGFWRAASQCAVPAEPAERACVAVIIPARNEAAVIGSAIRSLARQCFAGELHIVVIDDASTDGTAEAALAAARSSGVNDRVRVLRGAQLPHGWTGKLWAQAQGVTAAAALRPDYLLFTDADIEHGPHGVASLVARAEAERVDLVSYMVKLSVASAAERLLIPAFVFFFFMLYPPCWVASARHRLAAAAGGCMLIRPEMLLRVGGVAAIRSNIIDDCALARAVKTCGGRISLALTQESRSLRVYHSWREIGAMISRTAFAQLRHSYLLLLVTIAALLVTYLLAPALMLSGAPQAWFGLAGFTLMTLCYLPMVRFYGLSPLWALCLPAIALFYMGAVLHSAAQFARGRGGEWKGRTQDA